MNFPNIELLLDEQDYQNFLFLEIKKKIMLFIILSQTTPDANSIFAKKELKKAGDAHKNYTCFLFLYHFIFIVLKFMENIIYEYKV